MNKQENELQAAEVKLIYKSKIPASKRIQIKTSRDAFRIFLEHWNMDTIEHHEEFKVMLLNNKNEVLGIAEISKGGITSTVTDPRIVYQYALMAHATGIIVAHNHPSSNPTPSESDVSITKKLSEAGNILSITLLDHIILCADSTYYSLADEGRM
jgi:DNA repair protein RadC